MCQDILLNTIQYRAIIKTKSIISHTVTPEKLLSVQVHFSVQNSEGLVRFSNWSYGACNNHNNHKNHKNDNNPHLNFVEGTVLGDKEQGVGIRDKG